MCLLRCNPTVSRGTSIHTKYTCVCIHTYLYMHTYVHKHIHKWVYVDIKLLGNGDYSSFISFLLSDSFSVANSGGCFVFLPPWSSVLTLFSETCILSSSDVTNGSRACRLGHSHYRLCPQAPFKSNSCYPALVLALLKLRDTFNCKQEQTESVFKRKAGMASCGIFQID